MSDSWEIRYSILDLAMVPEGDTPAEAFRRSLEVARRAEAWGYTRFWLAEHHNMLGIASAATAVVIGYIAGGTSRIRVGSGGIMLPNHSSLIIAEQFGTLETLYPGRIDLGVGRAPGGDSATARTIRRGLPATEEDFPRQVQELLAYLGPAASGQPVRAIPGEDTNVPVWLLGSSTYSAQLAALLGLRFAFASHFAPEQMMEALAIYREYFRPSQSLQGSYAMIGVPVIASETDTEAQRLVTTPYQRFLQLIRGQPLFGRPPVESMDGLWSDSERAIVRQKLGAAIIGGPETVRTKLEALLERTRADEVMFTSDLYHLSDRLRSFEIVSEVIQAVGSYRR
jgi:luciferase family oxidoreductase group 1